MDDTYTGKKGMQIRGFTASLNADRTTEQHIIAFKQNFKKSIDGFAYGLHDKDRYTVTEVAKRQKMYDEIIEAGGTPDFDVPKVGDLKGKHWHIVCICKKRNPILLSSVAKLLNCEPHLICKLYNDKNSLLDGFGNMLAYLTHITDKAIKDGKHVYDSDIVKGLQFPQEGRYAKYYKDFQNYDDFRHIYEMKAFNKDSHLVQIMKGTITPDDLKESEPEFYAKNSRKIRELRLEYINGLPTPDCVTNYYIGAADSSQKGRTGKSTASRILAKVLLKGLFPECDFYQMSTDELNKYIYWVGGDGVMLQRYDGQPVIIWDDVRPERLSHDFGGNSNLYKALDKHPVPMSFHIKYGDVTLKNKVNIFNGINSYANFLKGLGELVELPKGGSYIDTSQVRGRIPFGMELSEDKITQFADFSFCHEISSDYNFRREIPNIMPAIAKSGDTAEYGKFFAEPYANLEKILRKNEPDCDELLTEDDIRQACIELPLTYTEDIQVQAVRMIAGLTPDEQEQFYAEYRTKCNTGEINYQTMKPEQYFFETHRKLFEGNRKDDDYDKR